MDKNDLAVADLMLQVTALQQILIKKGVFTADELRDETTVIMDKLLEIVSKTDNKG